SPQPLSERGAPVCLDEPALPAHLARRSVISSDRLHEGCGRPHGRLVKHAGALLSEEGLGGAVEQAGTPAWRGAGGAVQQVMPSEGRPPPRSALNASFPLRALNSRSPPRALPATRAA